MPEFSDFGRQKLNEVSVVWVKVLQHVVSAMQSNSLTVKNSHRIREALAVHAMCATGFYLLKTVRYRNARAEPLPITLLETACLYAMVPGKLTLSPWSLASLDRIPHLWMVFSARYARHPRTHRCDAIYVMFEVG